MSWMLDTNVCIRYLTGRSPAVVQRLDGLDPADILVCSVVKAELYFGAQKSSNPQVTRSRQDGFLSRFISLPFDDRAAEAYAVIRADLATRGMQIGGNDMLIAAIAIANQVRLVTHNAGEYGRISGLMIEDWEAP